MNNLSKHYLDCRITGLGIEYAGLIQTSVFGNKCTKWESTHILKGKKKEPVFKDSFFPDGNIYIEYLFQI